LKQAEWHALCKREQDNGGEVVGITLTPRSAQELANEVLGDASVSTLLYAKDGSPADVKHVVAGCRVGSLVNWAAKTVIDVDVDPDSEVDFLTVRYVQTRTVAIGA
jgi:hypothetical protein